MCVQSARPRQNRSGHPRTAHQHILSRTTLFTSLTRSDDGLEQLGPPFERARDPSQEHTRKEREQEEACASIAAHPSAYLVQFDLVRSMRRVAHSCRAV